MEKDYNSLRWSNWILIALTGKGTIQKQICQEEQATNQNQLIVAQVEPISLIDRQADKQFQGIYLLGTGSLYKKWFSIPIFTDVWQEHLEFETGNICRENCKGILQEEQFNVQLVVFWGDLFGRR